MAEFLKKLYMFPISILGKSYKMVDKRKPVPLNHIKLIFAELAHFHGKWLKYIQACKNGNLKKSDSADGGTVEPISWKTFTVRIENFHA